MMDEDMIDFNRAGYINNLKHVECNERTITEGRSWKNKRDEQFKRSTYEG